MPRPFSFKRLGSLKKSQSSSDDQDISPISSTATLTQSCKGNISYQDSPDSGRTVVAPWQKTATLYHPIVLYERNGSRTDDEFLPIHRKSSSRSQSPDNLSPWTRHFVNVRRSSSSSDCSFETDQHTFPPFPRYSHAIAHTMGTMIMFGGLVGTTPLNDLYVMSSRDLSARLVETTGDVPSPRFGHTCVLYETKVVVWGGETRWNHPDPASPLDDAIYIIDKCSSIWTRVDVGGPKPLGRYGHTAAVIGSHMYVFGGRRDETYFDDLWALNMETLTWELLFPMDGRTLTGLPTRPAARTNHASAVHGTDLLIFGGSDGEYHYSDLWAFDTEQYMWKQVRSEGPNPRSREGHAMVIVDHTLWVFGGRGSAGKDLAELSSCDLRYPRWYCFKNVASTPAPRSEHVMVAVKDHVFVLGGFDSKSNATEPYTIHVLDTEQAFRIPLRLVDILSETANGFET